MDVYVMTLVVPQQLRGALSMALVAGKKNKVRVHTGATF